MHSKASILAAVTFSLGGISLAGDGKQPSQKPPGLTYVLEKARTVPIREESAQDQIDVAFGERFPPDAVAEDPNSWLLRSIDESGNEAAYKPTKAEVFRADPTQNLVRLTMSQPLAPGAPLNPATHRITIRFQHANFPEVGLGQPAPAAGGAAFVAAKGKSDADIYLSGTVTAAHGSKPLYSLEGKLGYLWDVVAIGSLGAKGTIDSAEATDIDPDSITVSGAYERVIVLAPATGVIVRSGLIGLEIDKKDRNRNLTTDLDAVWVLPSARLGDDTAATVDFTTGFEGGHNYKRASDDTTSPDHLWRWKLAVSSYLLLLHPPGLERVNLSVAYTVRFLRSPEPFTEKINGNDVTTLKGGHRYYLTGDLDFMFSKAVGITAKYRYGSLPPAFKFVEQKVSLGLTLQLKQAR